MGDRFETKKKDEGKLMNRETHETNRQQKNRKEIPKKIGFLGVKNKLMIIKKFLSLPN